MGRVYRYTGMNCGGFVSHAYMKAGGNLAPIAAEQSHSPWSGGPGRGGCVNAYRWCGYAIDTCANVTYFNSIDEFLRSGLARKGDIVFFNPNNPYAYDSHIGFFGVIRRMKICSGIAMAMEIASLV